MAAETIAPKSGQGGDHHSEENEEKVSTQPEKTTQDEIELMRWADDGGYVPPDHDELG
jgi:hypothetical protein